MCPTEELKSFAQGEVPKEPFLVNILTFQADHLMQITTKLSYHKVNKKKFAIKQSNKSQITNTRLQSYYILERFRFYNDTIVLLVQALAKMLSCQNKSRMRQQFCHFLITKRAQLPAIRITEQPILPRKRKIIVAVEHLLSIFAKNGQSDLVLESKGPHFEH